MIVVPMAGLSRRFSEAGYIEPKYMLQAHGQTIFAHAVSSFERYFDDVSFLFVARDVFDTAEFIWRECKSLGIRSVDVVILSEPTAGQAETVAIGLNKIKANLEEPLTIFNIDTLRADFCFPSEFDIRSVDGYLEVFHGRGNNWSYVRPAPFENNRVAETTEKVPVSNLCCTGLYHFKSVKTFTSAYAPFAEARACEMGLRELYVAPIYNVLIENGCDIRYSVIDRSAVTFCGVPEEYLEFLRVGK